MFRYLKGTDDRGFVIGSIDEIQAQLDDHSLTLQSMSSSKYVAAFATQVQEWERSLSYVGEVLAVWMNVQTRWMYLESIFLGSKLTFCVC